MNRTIYILVAIVLGALASDLEICTEPEETSARRKRDTGSSIHYEGQEYEPENVMRATEALGMNQTFEDMGEFLWNRRCSEDVFRIELNNSAISISDVVSTGMKQLELGESQTLLVKMKASGGSGTVSFAGSEKVIMDPNDEIKGARLFGVLAQEATRVSSLYIAQSGSSPILCDGRTLVYWSGQGSLMSRSDSPTSIPANQAQVWRWVILEGKSSFTKDPSEFRAQISNYGICFTGKSEKERVVAIEREVQEKGLERGSCAIGVDCSIDVYLNEVTRSGVSQSCPNRLNSCTNERRETLTDPSLTYVKIWNRGSEPDYAKGERSSECDCDKRIPHKKGTGAVIRGVSISDGSVCENIGPQETESLVVKRGPFRKVSNSSRRKRASGFCLLICVGFGSFDDEIKDLRTDFNNFRDALQRNQDIIEKEIGDLYKKTNEIISYQKILAGEVEALRVSLNELTLRVNEFITQQTKFNYAVVASIHQLELGALITELNIRALSKFLTRGGEVLEGLYPGVFERSLSGCYRRRDGGEIPDALFTFTGPDPQILNITLPPPPEKLDDPKKFEALPSVRFEQSSLNVGFIVAIVIIAVIVVVILVCCYRRRRNKARETRDVPLEEARPRF